MFGFGKKKVLPIGAAEKIAAAERMREAARLEMLQKTGGIQEAPSQTVPLAIVFGMAVIFALVLVESGNNPFSGWHPTGISSIDSLLVGSDIPSIMGDGDIDKLIVIMIRGIFYFLMAGLIPLFSLIIMRLTGKSLTPLVACWGVTIALPGICYFLVPFIMDLGGF